MLTFVIPGELLFIKKQSTIRRCLDFRGDIEQDTDLPGTDSQPRVLRIGERERDRDRDRDRDNERERDRGRDFELEGERESDLESLEIDRDLERYVRLKNKLI